MNIREIKNQVLQNADIVEVVKRFEPLKRAGSGEWSCLCPFHAERSPSFMVNSKKGIFKCFGCGASGDVIEFVMKHQGIGFIDALNLIANAENIPLNYDNDGFGRKLTKGQTKEIEFKTIDKSVLERTLKSYETNSFALSLADRLSGDVLSAALIRYGVGTAKNGGTVFWQIDQFLRVRSAQLIFYDPKTAHRIKEIPPRRLYTVDQGYKPCFFGEHLLFEAGPDDVVCIVESEKTAVICSVWLPDLSGRRAVWIAAGGANGITEAKAQALRGMRVCLVPDFSWTSRAVWGLVPMRRDQAGKINQAGEVDPEYISRAMMLNKMGCDVSFYDPCPELLDNSDIADVLLQLPETRAIAAPDFDSLTL
jgi:hypothetical protein